jgi:hypothetical protein
MIYFVFGSNEAGYHGAGSALEALLHHGAKNGIGEGPSGSSYAIPTKDSNLKTLSKIEIFKYVRAFIKFAKEHPKDEFEIVKIGCGLAGYNDADIAPMFFSLPQNCIVHSDWYRLIKDANIERNSARRLSNSEFVESVMNESKEGSMTSIYLVNLMFIALDKINLQMPEIFNKEMIDRIEYELRYKFELKYGE